jgi:hypothetical protein
MRPKRWVGRMVQATGSFGGVVVLVVVLALVLYHDVRGIPNPCASDGS